MKRTLYWGAALLTALFAVIGTAHAQDAASLKLQPTLVEQRVDPGQNFSSDLKITNLSDKAQTLHVFVRDISNVTPSGEPIFSAPGEVTGYELSSWIKLRDQSFEVAPGEVHVIPFSVAVPKGAGPGGHFGAIVVAQEGSALPQTGAGVGYQISSLLSLRISGEVIEEADIREFSVDKQVYSTPHVAFTTKVENLGNVLVRPQGFIEVANMWGKTVASVGVNGSNAGVFPKSNRVFDASWDDEGLGFGRYQATLSMVYGEDGRKTISRTLSFWILPMKIILPILGVLLLLLIIIVVVVKMYVRSKLRGVGGARAPGGTASMEATPGFARVLLFTLSIAAIVILLLVGLFLLF